MLRGLFLFCVIGPLVAEFSGYLWHRFISHVGILSWLPNDFLRRRHFHHHEEYPINKIRDIDYVKSCDSTFNMAGFITYLIVFSLVLLKVITLLSFLLVIISGTLFGFLISIVHDSYHVKYLELKKHWRWLFKFQWFRKYYVWARRCHDMHHIVNANYFIIIPVDWFFGTLVTKKPEAHDELFPRFDPALISSCKKPMIRR